jgi:hypothetical protein
MLVVRRRLIIRDVTLSISKGRLPRAQQYSKKSDGEDSLFKKKSAAGVAFAARYVVRKHKTIITTTHHV